MSDQQRQKRASGKVPADLQHLLSTSGRRIHVYRNGDLHFKGIEVALNPHQIHNFDQLLDEISEKIGLIKGVRRLYSLEGLPITTFEQLENKHEYVASSGGFTQLNYGKQRPPIGIGRIGAYDSLSSSEKSSLNSSSSSMRKSTRGSAATVTNSRSRSKEINKKIRTQSLQPISRESRSRSEKQDKNHKKITKSKSRDAKARKNMVKEESVEANETPNNEDSVQMEHEIEVLHHSDEEENKTESEEHDQMGESVEDEEQTKQDADTESNGQHDANGDEKEDNEKEEETEDEDGDKNTDEEQAESDKIKTVQHKPEDEVSKE